LDSYAPTTRLAGDGIAGLLIVAVSLGRVHDVCDENPARSLGFTVH
jgi:hypothetical protein